MRFNFTLLLYLFLLLAACTSKENGSQRMAYYLKEKSLVADRTLEAELDELLPAVNCIARKFTTKYIVPASKFDATDTNQVLLIPFRNRTTLGTSSGFTDLENRLIFICPPQIKDFVLANSLSDSASINGYLGLILLHELGHFISNTPGQFDEGTLATDVTPLGEQDMGTTPYYLTGYKRLELKVDSIAVAMLTKTATTPDSGCLSACWDIQLAINGAEFMLFGKRTLGNFGSDQPDLLKDMAWSHPNIELRMAFMNYYLNPTEEKRTQIDNYLYEREIAPLQRQLTDPRIYQGEYKILPDEE